MGDDHARQPITPAAFTPLADHEEQTGKSLSPLQILLGAALITVLLVLWFLFSARSVLIATSPPGASFNLDGGLQLRIGGRVLVRPGDLDIELSTPGYYPLQSTITVGEESSQSFEFTLQKLPGRVTLTSQPEGAQVIIDGEVVGVTPLNDAEVAAGERQLTLAADRYKPRQETLIVAGMEQPQSLELVLDPAWAEVTFTSIPAGASVVVDGESLANTPATVELLEGEHQVSLQLNTYRDWQQQIDVIAGEPQSFPNVMMLPAEGVLDLTSQPNRANVTLNGEFQGQTPLQLSLEPGVSHRIAMFKPGFSNTQRNVTLKPEQVQALQLRLKPLLGEILVRVQPDNARVSVEGKRQGSGSQTLSLPAYEQLLTVEAPGYKTHQQRFTPREGLSQIINVRLLSEAEARVAALKPRINTRNGEALRLFTPTDFTMGASRREPGRRSNEVLHPVSLTRMFYLAETEVTNGQYRKFMQSHNSGRVQNVSLDNDRQPVVMVSWNDAARYCNWLSKQEKLKPFYVEENQQVVGFDPASTGYRLPSEAEWAWAARVEGEELRKFSWGSRFPPSKVVENMADKSSAYITGRTIAGYNDGHVLSAPVASFPANHRGIHDLGGNVAEWIHDVYGIPATNGIPVRDPLGEQNGNNHVIRGASWAQGTVTELRLSFRDYGNRPRDDVGFRIARYSEAQ